MKLKQIAEGIQSRTRTSRGMWVLMEEVTGEAPEGIAASRDKEKLREMSGVPVEHWTVAPHSMYTSDGDTTHYLVYVPKIVN